MNTNTSAVQNYLPETASHSFADRCQDAIDAIKGTMAQVAVTTLAMSYGKDSCSVLALALEAASQVLNETGVSPRVRLITADTLVENPLQVKLTTEMSARALQFAQDRDLDVEQVWVTPENASHYLVTMIGGRGVASMPGSSATCSVSLKIQPMDRVRRKLAKEYGAENIAVLTGVRHEESAQRSQRMTQRGESAIEAYRTDTGSLQLAPIADWTEGDVWRLLNGNQKAIGFETLSFEPVVVHYELSGDSSCGTPSLGDTAKKAKSPCKGGRGGCFVCQKVTKDYSMENLVEKVPGLEPLVRLSKTIRAGHYLPENRSFLSKAADDKNRIRVFSNAYSGSWCSALLKMVMSIDATEDLRAARAADKYAEAKAAGASETVLKQLRKKATRQWPRLLTDEQLMLVAFYWSRYGVQKPGEFARIREAIMQGKRWALPTDEELADMEARADRKLMGQTFGYLQSDFTNPGEGTYRDHYRDMIGTESGCAPAIMVDDRGERAVYRSGNGMVHDTIETGEVVDADLSGFASEMEKEDFLWWYAMEFAGGTKSHNAEMDFLIREGVIVARKGYQSTLAEYQRFNLHLHWLREQGSVDTLEAILSHPQFITMEEAEAADRGQAPVGAYGMIATDAAPRVEPATEEPVSDAEKQMDLFAA